MKKTILKSIAAITIVGAAIALSSVAAFAATTYNFADITNITSTPYSGSTITALTADTKLTFSTGGSNTISVVKALNPTYVDYTSNATKDKNYLENGATTGTLNGTALTDVLFTNSSNDGSKAFMTISDVKQGDVVEIYYVGTDSKGAPGKAATISITDGGSTAFTDATAAGTPSSAATGYVSFTATADGDVKLTSTKVGSDKTRIGIAAIVITPASEAAIAAGSYEVAEGKVIVTDTSAYAIAAVSNTKVQNNSSLDIVLGNDCKVNTDTVYKSVVINGEEVTAASLGADYLYAVEINGLANCADVACVKSFTVSYTANATV